jgi:CBS domain containing-hemolysin-like protein
MRVFILAALAGIALLLLSADPASVFGQEPADPLTAVVLDSDAPSPWDEKHLHPYVLAGVVCLLLLSGFFSGSETAFFSIQRLRLRAMADETARSGRRVSAMMDRPNRLLTTILVGNMLVNVLIGVVLGTRVEHTFSDVLEWSTLPSFLMAVTLTTLVLVFFGEILPKALAVHGSESFARIMSLPLASADRVLAPMRNSCMAITNFLFRVTRFHDYRAAPFITDEQFRALLSGEEAQHVMEKDDIEMIQGILESTDALLKEILTPRPDVTALPEESTVADALAVLKEHECTRVPTYRDNLDHVTGLLVAKDMLPALRQGELDRKVETMVRPAHFVPHTMTVHQFVKEAQRHKTHLAIVVDEYGGTAGIVTLEDAMEEVVGDILDEKDEVEQEYERIGEHDYRVDGNMPLDELSELIDVPIQDEEHETLAGFIMAKSDKVPEIGDTVEHGGVVFSVVECDGKRVEWVKVRVGAGVASGREGGRT